MTDEDARPVLDGIVSDDDDFQPPTPRRKSIVKAPFAMPAFTRLPPEIIQQILRFSDPNTFASLTLLNSTWLRASLDPKIYAHQLRRCGVTFPPDSEDSVLPLKDLIHQFGVESRRALFVSTLSPNITTYHLLSTSPSSVGALPGGESLRFIFSPSGKTLLALSSARIFVLSLATGIPTVDRELKLSRRPVSAAILDDGTILAVLFYNHRVSFYDLEDKSAPSKHLRSMTLDHSPRAIALSPKAAVLAAAYDHGIEVYSLYPIKSGSGATVDSRRAVKCDAVDNLAFSPDGTVLLGTTTTSPNPISSSGKYPAPATTTVAISAPFLPLMEGEIDPSEYLSQIWTTQLLFPRSSRDSSHATLLPTPEKSFLAPETQLPEHSPEDAGLGWDPEVDTSEMTWTFAHDSVFGTFRAVRLDDLRNGHTYFAGPSAFGSASVGPSTLPASKSDGTVCATGFAPNGGVYIYGIPSRLDLSPSSLVNQPEGASGSLPGSSSSLGRSNSNGGAWSAQAAMQAAVATEPGSVLLPQLQGMCDRYRNVFLAGRKIGDDIAGLQSVKWVKTTHGNGTEAFQQEKLIAVATGYGSDSASGHRASEQFEMMNPEAASNRDSTLSTPSEDWAPVPRDPSAAEDGGRIVVYDFSRSPGGSYKEKVVMELGLGSAPGVIVETLKEVLDDLETEVDLVRRRTVAAQRARPTARGGTSTTAAATSRRRVSRGATVHDSPGRRDRRLSASTPSVPQLEVPPSHSRSNSATFSPADDSDDEEIYEMPYGHNEPRARGTLQRAATAAAARSVHTPRTYPVAAPPIPAIPEGTRQYDPRQMNYNPALDSEIEYPPPPPYAPAERPDHISVDIDVERVMERAATMGIPLERVTEIPPMPAARSATTPSVSPSQHPQQGGSSLGVALERTRSRFERAGNMMRRGISGDFDRRDEPSQTELVPSRPRPLGRGFEHLHDGGGATGRMETGAASSSSMFPQADPFAKLQMMRQRKPVPQSQQVQAPTQQQWPTRTSSAHPPAASASTSRPFQVELPAPRPQHSHGLGSGLSHLLPGARTPTSPGPGLIPVEHHAPSVRSVSSSSVPTMSQLASAANNSPRPVSVMSLRSLTLQESLARPLPPPPPHELSQPSSPRSSLQGDRLDDASIDTVQGHAAYPRHMQSYTNRRLSRQPQSDGGPPNTPPQAGPSSPTTSIAPSYFSTTAPGPQPLMLQPHQIPLPLASPSSTMHISPRNPQYFNPMPPIPPTPGTPPPRRTLSRVSRNGILRRRGTHAQHHAIHPPRPERASSRARDARMKRIMRTVGGQVDMKVQRVVGAPSSRDGDWEDVPEQKARNSGERPRFGVKGPNDEKNCLIM